MFVRQREISGTEFYLGERRKTEVSVYRATLLLACCHIRSLHKDKLFPLALENTGIWFCGSTLDKGWWIHIFIFAYDRAIIRHLFDCFDAPEPLDISYWFLCMCVSTSSLCMAEYVFIPNFHVWNRPLIRKAELNFSEWLPPITVTVISPPGNAISKATEPWEDGGVGGPSQGSYCGVSLTVDPFMAGEFLLIFKALFLMKTMPRSQQRTWYGNTKKDIHTAWELRYQSWGIPSLYCIADG